jgi:hypothetical protein
MTSTYVLAMVVVFAGRTRSELGRGEEGSPGLARELRSGERRDCQLYVKQALLCFYIVAVFHTPTASVQRLTTPYLAETGTPGTNRTFATTNLPMQQDLGPHSHRCGPNGPQPSHDFRLRLSRVFHLGPPGAQSQEGSGDQAVGLADKRVPYKQARADTLGPRADDPVGPRRRMSGS